MHLIRRVREGTEELVLRRRQLKGVATDRSCAMSPVDGERPDHLQQLGSRFRGFGRSRGRHQLWCGLQRMHERLLGVSQQSEELLALGLGPLDTFPKPIPVSVYHTQPLK